MTSYNMEALPTNYTSYDVTNPDVIYEDNMTSLYDVNGTVGGEGNMTGDRRYGPPPEWTWMMKTADDFRNGTAAIAMLGLIG